MKKSKRAKLPTIYVGAQFHEDLYGKLSQMAAMGSRSVAAQLRMLVRDAELPKQKAGV